MELEERDGEIIWVKKDGSPAKRNVSDKRRIDFCEFPFPPESGGGACKSLTIIKGNPIEDDVVLVEAGGYSWHGKYLLSRTDDDCVRIRDEERELAEKLVEENRESIREEMESLRQEKRDSVDIEALAKERGLKVWESKYFDGYWCREYDEFDDIPDGWDFLPSGDGALTRRVRKGPHWILMRKKHGYSKPVGTIAPSDNIRKAREELGGEEGAKRREKAKKRGQKKREKRITRKLKKKIRQEFPNIPEKELEEVTSRARKKGKVGSADWVYFSPEEDEEMSLRRAAKLAVKAHIRHNHTNYDQLLSRGVPKDEARLIVSGEIEKALEKWKKPPNPSSGKGKSSSDCRICKEAFSHWFGF
ncbi:hypothetical protein AKJ57_01800 [candidate division MSBL1 archaeon SCGC-AAA259A05]|uniref:DUF2293 domain-containing protein n=1 Tax=candidate division MSBL1 archaeon SCGC-AAA259A05 TaxID=1698259 RepID=A0A133UAU7_9EURY|nr:hypothetical protein AKJ57_01800 [candidate division MSBL1 archaeon SCGC-AAA259A05]